MYEPSQHLPRMKRKLRRINEGYVGFGWGLDRANEEGGVGVIVEEGKPWKLKSLRKMGADCETSLDLQSVLN